MLSNRLELDERTGVRVHELRPARLDVPTVNDILDFQRLLRHLDDHRIGSLARPGMKATIVFTDSTRYSPDALVVGTLVQLLTEHGVSERDITLLCATGLHRPTTIEERIQKLGPELVRKLTVLDHQALNEDLIVEVGEIDGLPVTVNRHCLESDLLFVTGVVEPHQYAGYSGGYKSVVIGCGGERTIAATHCIDMLDRPGVGLGRIEGNPLQSFIREAGEMIGVDMAVNVLLDADGCVMDAAAGRPDRVHDALIARARELNEVVVDRPMHLAIASMSSAKSQNLYQSTRAATYLALAEGSPLIDGAPIVVMASMPEGAGDGTGERRFFEKLSTAASPKDALEKMRSEGCPAGAQRAYFVARALEHHPIIMVGGDAEVVRACRMLHADDLEQGYAMAIELARAIPSVGENDPLDVMVVPNAIVTLPRMTEAGIVG